MSYKQHITDTLEANKATLAKAFITITTASVPFVEALSVWIRLIGGMVAIFVGLLTIYKLCRELFLRNK